MTMVGCVCGVWWGWGREMRKRIFFLILLFLLLSCSVWLDSLPSIIG